MESMKQIVNAEISSIPLSPAKEVQEIEPKPFSQNQMVAKDISSSNYSELLSFLDEVDRSCSKPINEAKESAKTLKAVKISLDSVPKFEDLVTCTNEELARHIIDSSLRIKEKSSSITLLQSELTSLRDQVVN